MPFGQVPLLEHNGKRINQSVAIARYVAKQVKLVGNNDWEDLEIDAIVDTICDFRQSKALHREIVIYLKQKLSEIGNYHYETDPAIKESRKEPLFTETLPYYLDRLDALVKANNGHLALGRVSV